MSVPPLSPGEMQLLLSRAGLALNPGQVADLVLAWRQVAGLIAAMPHDRPLADDMAFAFRLPAARRRRRPAPLPARRAPRKPKALRSGQAGRQRPRPRRRPKRRAARPVARKSGKSRAMTGTAPPFLTIAQAGRLIAAKRLSPVELAKELLARIEATDPQLNAFLLVTERQALAAARAAERAVMAGQRARRCSASRSATRTSTRPPACAPRRIPGSSPTMCRSRMPRRCAGCMPKAR